MKQLPESFYFYVLDDVKHSNSTLRFGCVFQAVGYGNGYQIFMYGDSSFYVYPIPRKKLTKSFIKKLEKLYPKDNFFILPEVETLDDIKQGLQLQQNTVGIYEQ
jgi:hypothetical protein